MTAYRKTVIGCLIGIVAMPLLGCRDRTEPFSLGKAVKKIFVRRSAEEDVTMAFDPDSADNRREGVISLSKRSWGLEEPFLKSYAILLREDTDPSVRCAAVRALGKAGSAECQKYLPDIVAALSDESPLVRWDAAVALDSIIGESAVAPLTKHALSDRSNDVRMCCATALRHYRRGDVATTLVECLSDDAFSVRHAARASLVELTGRDLGYQPKAWGHFGRGELPSTQPAQTNRPWWNRLGLGKSKQEPTSVQ